MEIVNPKDGSVAYVIEETTKAKLTAAFDHAKTIIHLLMQSEKLRTSLTFEQAKECAKWITLEIMEELEENFDNKKGNKRYDYFAEVDKYIDCF